MKQQMSNGFYRELYKPAKVEVCEEFALQRFSLSDRRWLEKREVGEVSVDWSAN